ncbi:hypothetical protein [Carboxylicivirga sp. M1479]|uniref:hypothetical protein n=1 Tax=Carboxylicivirga sp. M1479 TaxID=2594476 RepID=UPI00117798AD|nr:hypothetical protein [Carboxylicivirga sp. M1479]TRX71307.1 hypothetical protein FNN09_06865 [Carboxylicivirga sp. M1479]
MRRLLFVFFSFLVLTSCVNIQPTEMDEGVITYKIIYPNELEDKSYSSLLPSKMVSTFKGKNYKLSIKGELSLYNLEYISKADGDSSATLFRIFDQRLFHKHEQDEHLFLFERLEKTNVDFISNETKEIAGILCNKAIVHFTNSELKNITVYYTEEIKINRPKENSPFDDIPGALMEFQVSFQDLELQFSAQDVDIKKVKNSSFDIPKNYKHSERGEIDEIVASLIQL